MLDNNHDIWRVCVYQIIFSYLMLINLTCEQVNVNYRCYYYYLYLARTSH